MGQMIFWPIKTPLSARTKLELINAFEKKGKAPLPWNQIDYFEETFFAFSAIMFI